MLASTWVGDFFRNKYSTTFRSRVTHLSNICVTASDIYIYIYIYILVEIYDFK